MKNKLMKTTALVGSLIFLGTSASVAQTTVTGNLDLSYRTLSAPGTGEASGSGFGKESQINVRNKGKLNNGMDYAAGFSLEYDGTDVGAAGTHGEQVYINFISGNTTLHVGADHIQNPDSHAHINPAGVGYITYYGPAGGPGLYPADANSPYAAYGFGLIQAVPGFGNFSAFFAPNDSNALAQADIHNGNARNTDGESNIEVGFRGDLGVKGLTVLAFTNSKEAEDNNPDQRKEKGTRIGASYNFGQITAGADWVKVRNGSQEANAFIGEEIKGKAVSLTYAATKDLSIGGTYGKADTDFANAPETEKTKIISVGYNLGPVVLNAQYQDVESIGGAADTDATSFIIKASTLF
jgi:hypothetical protein